MTESPHFPGTIAKWLQGANVDPIALEEPYRTVLQKALELAPDYDDFRPRALDAALNQFRGDSAGLREEIYRAAYASIGTDQTSEDDDSIVPQLPSSVRYDRQIAQQECSWIDTYVAWADAASPMTPRLFHVSAALSLGSIAIARRLFVPMAFGDIFPNLYTLWIAPSTLYRKSTALSKARWLGSEVIPYLLMPQDSTPEALLESMAGKEPVNLSDLPEPLQRRWAQTRHYCAQQGLILDELSGLLNGSRKDYNAGLVEAFLRFYDCNPDFTRHTATKGLLHVRNAYVTLLGASTPAALANHLTREKMWANGWWPRFTLLTPESSRPPWRLAQDAEEPGELQDTLRRLMEKLPAATYPEPPADQPVMLDKGVFDLWSAYSRAMSYDLLTPELDHRLYALYGRLPTQLLKVATILAALSWATTSEDHLAIRMPHLIRALNYIEECRESAHRVLNEVTKSRYDSNKERVYAAIANGEPDGRTLRDLQRSVSIEKPELKTIVEDLFEDERIGKTHVKPGPQGGRPTTRYHLARE